MSFSLNGIPIQKAASDPMNGIALLLPSIASVLRLGQGQRMAPAMISPLRRDAEKGVPDRRQQRRSGREERTRATCCFYDVGIYPRASPSQRVAAPTRNMLQYPNLRSVKYSRATNYLATRPRESRRVRRWTSEGFVLVRKGREVRLRASRVFV